MTNPPNQTKFSISTFALLFILLCIDIAGYVHGTFSPDFTAIAALVLAAFALFFELRGTSRIG